MDRSRTCVAHRSRRHGSGGSIAPARRPARRRTGRRLCGIVVAGAATMLFGPAGVATAGDCQVTDLPCATAIGDLRQTADQTLDDTTGTAEGELAAVADTAASTLDGLTDTVGQPPDVDPGVDDVHHAGSPSHGPAGSASGDVRHPRSAGDPGVQAHRPGVEIREGGTVTAIGTAINGHAEPADQRPGPIGLREAATGIALSLLVVVGAVLLFMAIQARLDRRDPKLAVAPVTADVVTFV